MRRKRLLPARTQLISSPRPIRPSPRRPSHRIGINLLFLPFLATAVVSPSLAHAWSCAVWFASVSAGGVTHTYDEANQPAEAVPISLGEPFTVTLASSADRVSPDGWYWFGMDLNALEMQHPAPTSPTATFTARLEGSHSITGKFHGKNGRPTCGTPVALPLTTSAAVFFNEQCSPSPPARGRPEDAARNLSCPKSAQVSLSAATGTSWKLQETLRFDFRTSALAVETAVVRIGANHPVRQRELCGKRLPGRGQRRTRADLARAGTLRGYPGAERGLVVTAGGRGNGRAGRLPNGLGGAELRGGRAGDEPPRSWIVLTVGGKRSQPDRRAHRGVYAGFSCRSRRLRRRARPVHGAELENRHRCRRHRVGSNPG